MLLSADSGIGAVDMHGAAGGVFRSTRENCFKAVYNSINDVTIY
jgi:hypothetical protein